MITDFVVFSREEYWEKFSLTFYNLTIFPFLFLFPTICLCSLSSFPSFLPGCLKGITTENRHDQIDRNSSGLVHSISENQWLVYMEKFLNINIRKFKHDSTSHRKTTTFLTSTQPAGKYCSYSHLIPFTLHCGQSVWPGNLTFWFSVWWRCPCMRALIVKNSTTFRDYMCITFVGTGIF